MTTNMVPALRRQCGRRKKGGVYLTAAEGPNGRPFRSFLYDPPIRIGAIDDLHKLGIGPRGAHLIERAGDNAVADVIGQEFYPNVWDWIVEAERHGISRLVSTKNHTFPFHLLNRNTRLLFIHQRAIIKNYQAIVAEMGPEERHEFECVRLSPPFHRIGALKEQCAGLWRHDVEKLEETVLASPGDDRRAHGVRRLECSAQYRGFRSQEIAPMYEFGWVGSFPIGPIQVVEDPQDGLHEESLKAARRASLDVELVKG